MAALWRCSYCSSFQLGAHTKACLACLREGGLSGSWNYKDGAGFLRMAVDAKDARITELEARVAVADVEAGDGGGASLDDSRGSRLAADTLPGARCGTLACVCGFRPLRKGDWGWDVTLAPCCICWPASAHGNGFGDLMITNNMCPIHGTEPDPRDAEIAELKTTNEALLNTLEQVTETCERRLRRLGSRWLKRMDDVADLRERLARAEAESKRLGWGVAANAGRLSARTLPRWSHVMESTGLGSTSAKALCVAHGFGPDERAGGPSHLVIDADIARAERAEAKVLPADVVATVRDAVAEHRANMEMWRGRREWLIDEAEAAAAFLDEHYPENKIPAPPEAP